MIESVAGISVAPFDVGARLQMDTAALAFDETFQHHGWQRIDIDEKTIANMGPSIVYESIDLPQRRVVLSESGFGVLIFEDPEPEKFHSGREFRAQVHCVRRRSRHQAILNYSHEASRGIEELVRLLRICARKSVSKQWWRDIDRRVLHYVMTTYLVETTDISQLTEFERKSLAILLNPSVLNLDDTQFTAAAIEDTDSFASSSLEMKHQVDVGEFNLDEFNNLDTGQVTEVRASWSSVAVIGSVDSDTKSLVTALQSRVQISWFAAWSVQDITSRMARSARSTGGSISSRSLNWQAVELMRIKRSFQGRVDASESSRIERLLRGFEKTSGLKKEWAVAESSLVDAREFASLVTEDSNYRRQVAIELLIYLFTFASFAPIFLDLPLDEWSDVTDQLARIIPMVALILLGSWLILRRRR